MFFTDFEFFVFLPIVMGVYWVLPHRAQNVWLLGASYLFYSYAVPWTGIVMLLVSLVNYYAALVVERDDNRKRAALIASVVLSLSFLVWFKYTTFLLENLKLLFPELSFSLSIFLPAGISFFTFQAMAYTADVYSKRCHAEKNLIDFLLFISFFPQLVAGPIERASNLLKQVIEPRRFEGSQAWRGIDLLVLGYVKKVVVADNVATYVNMIFDLKHPSTALVLVGAIGFSIQILADFSAYTDIARGTARLFGFELMENFRHPYIAKNPSEFWSRWHISLSNLIRDYLYIPLGGSRVSLGRWIVNLGIVWFLCGLWHGAGWNFILWGLYWGAIIIGYRFVKVFPDKGWSVVPRIIVMNIWIIIGWFIFRVRDLTLVQGYVSERALALSVNQFAVTFSVLALFMFYALPLFISFIFEETVKKNVEDPWRGTWIRTLGYTAGAIVLVLFGAEQGVDFYYFQF